VFKRRKDEPKAAEPSPADPAAPAPSPAGQADTGLGVPPFRPAQPQEAQMARSPFNPTPTPPAGTPTGMPAVPQPPPIAPAGTAIPPRPPGIAGTPGALRPGETRERRTLVVGRGISVQGTVQDAERLVVEGTVEASMIHATELAIAHGGMFKGEIEVEDAAIDGTIDGTLTARGSLIVRATGRVLGTARCRRLQVEDGGQITGRIEMLTEGAAPSRVEPARPMSAPAPAEAAASG
jgi:cytoskeletal protein CcmA (bactofilin family)